MMITILIRNCLKAEQTIILRNEMYLSEKAFIKLFSLFTDSSRVLKRCLVKNINIRINTKRRKSLKSK